MTPRERWRAVLLGRTPDRVPCDWPRPEDWDYSGLRALCDEWRDYPILCGSSEPFYLYCRLRGMEQAFHGAVDNQRTLPFGTPAEVRAEVAENLRVFERCRYVVAPCHDIQPITPTANIPALYEAVADLGQRG